MQSKVHAFVTLPVSLQRARQARANVCACHAGFARTGSAACAALVLAHALTSCSPSLAAPVPPGATISTAVAEAPAAAPVNIDNAPNEESVAELRARSARNTRTSGAASRLFSRATRTAAGGDLRGAEDLYNELIAESPTFAPAYSNLGNVLVARGAYADAEMQYTRALELAPRARDSWLIHVNRGSVRLARGEARAALEDMNTAETLAPGESAVLANRGGVWEALGKYDNAMRDYQNALKGNEVQPFWLKYGLVLFERGKSYEAISVLNRVAARLGGDDVSAAQAVVLFNRGELGLAESSWSKVERPRLYESAAFLEGDRKWPPKAVQAMQRFRGMK